MSTSIHEIIETSETLLEAVTRWVASTEGFQVSGVKHDGAHSLRVDQIATPGEKVKRTFWCTCGERFGTSYDSPAITAYRAHRKSA